MCRAVTCRTCGKTTWAGCGQHVETALAGVPPADRCRGHEDAPTPAAEAGSGSAGQPSGFLARLFGR